MFRGTFNVTTLIKLSHNPGNLQAPELCIYAALWPGRQIRACGQKGGCVHQTKQCGLSPCTLVFNVCTIHLPCSPVLTRESDECSLWLEHTVPYDRQSFHCCPCGLSNAVTEPVRPVTHTPAITLLTTKRVTSLIKVATGAAKAAAVAFLASYIL